MGTGRVKRAKAAERRRELEIEMIEEFGLTMPPETEPLPKSRRDTHLGWRKEALDQARRERIRAQRLRLLRRALTWVCGGGKPLGGTEPHVQRPAQLLAHDGYGCKIVAVNVAHCRPPPTSIGGGDKCGVRPAMKGEFISSQWPGGRGGGSPRGCRSRAFGRR